MRDDSFSKIGYRTVMASITLLLVATCMSGRSSVAVGVFDNPQIAESSALVRSRQYDGVFWTLNDSGDRARIFAIDNRARSLGEYEVIGATNVDWESIAVDADGHLYLADLGNNLNARRDLVVYRVPEPDPRVPSKTVTVDRVIRVRYPEQQARPDPLDMNYDAEALFWSGETLYVLTKHRSDPGTVLYRFPSLDSDQEVDLIRISEFDTGDTMVTGADTTPDESYLAVLTYRRIYLFEKPADSDDYLSRPLKSIEFDENVTMQCEGITWEEKALYFTNEQMELHRIDEPLAKGVTRYP